MADNGGRGWWFLGGMALGHTLSDFYAVTFTPLVETFRTRFGMDEAGVGVIGAVIGVFASMVQPLFGLWSDRANRGTMAALGLVVSAVFIGLIGLAPNVYALTALLVAGALGVAAFHPTGATLATSHLRQRSLAMGVFLGGGGLGLALAPLAVPRVVDRFGLPNLWLVCFPGLLLGLWVYAATRGEPRARPRRQRLALRALFARGTAPIWALLAMGSLRAFVFTSFIYYMTVLGAHRGWDRAHAGQVLSLVMASSFLGGLCGGYLGQRISQRFLLLASCVLAAPMFYLFALPEGASVAAAGAGGFVFGIGAPLNVSFAQELRPQSASAVSGLMMGLAWGVANVLLIPVGLLAKHCGIEEALQLVACLAPVAGAFMVFLPSRRPEL